MSFLQKQRIMNTNQCIGAAGALLAWIVCAENPTGPRADSSGNAEWEVLFDGDSTDQFRAFRRDSFPSGGWKIEDGQLRTIPGGEEIDIVTKETYGDFDLSFEWKAATGANGGVIYRVSEAFGRSWHTGPEYQLLDDAGHPDGKNPLTATGSLYTLVSAEGKTLKPAGEYNASRIVAQGGRIEHWLNGRKVVAIELGGYAANQLIAKSKFANMPRFAKEPSGHICLQHHRDEVWFRNVKVRRLPPPSLPAPARKNNRLSLEQRRAGWQNLFNGQNTVRWRGFLKEEFPKIGWVVEHGALKHLSQGGGGSIVTKSRYREFDFRFEWRVATGANSGVKYFILEKERRQPIGHEYQIIDDGKHADARRGAKRQTAAFYDCLPAKNRVLKPVGQFNASRILVNGKQVEHWLNGVMVLNYTLGRSELLQAIAKSKFKNVKGFGQAHRGRILLQDHGDEVAYRNLRIKKL